MGLSLLSLSFSSLVAADNLSEICERVERLNFPAEDRPSPEVAKALDSCSSYNCYYGINGPIDMKKESYVLLSN